MDVNNAIVRFKNMSVEMQLEQNDIVGSVIVTNDNTGDSITVELPDGGGGGGGGSTDGLVLIDEIDVNGRAVQVDYKSSWDEYDFFVIHPNLTLSASDWLYVAINGTSSNRYTDQLTESNNITVFVRRNNNSTNPLLAYCFYKDDKEPFSNGSFSYLYIYTYSSSNTMTGTAKVYAGKYTE